MVVALARVRKLGRISYAAGLALQESLAKKYKEVRHNQAGEVLLCEHDPVYTFGLREKDYAEEAKRLQQFGAEVFKVRRGGLVTFHGPGQLVCYPVLNLAVLKLGVREYVQCLEKSVIRTCAEFGVHAQTTEYTGVWAGDKKICAIGIQVSRSVAFHGLALNCSTDLSWFDHIVPCGIEGKEVTSLTQLLGTTVSSAQVAPILVESLAKTIGFTVVADER